LAARRRACIAALVAPRPSPAPEPAARGCAPGDRHQPSLPARTRLGAPDARCSEAGGSGVRAPGSGGGGERPRVAASSGCLGVDCRPAGTGGACPHPSCDDSPV
jgi:hypothetical protein